MQSSQHQRPPNIFPAIRYADATRAMHWLEQTCGFRKQLVVDGPDNTIAHAQLQLGAGMVMLGLNPAEPDPMNPWDHADQGVYVFVEDIEEHYERARAAGAEIVRELEDTDYGSREYTARDPEGHLWSFGTYQPLKANP